MTYTLQLMTLTALRTIEWHRMEAAAARRDARESRRLTLKCGGRVMHLEAMNFLTAKAAGHYAEIEFQTGSHLARITLAELQNQLLEAKVDAVRCHRSSEICMHLAIASASGNIVTSAGPRKAHSLAGLFCVRKDTKTAGTGTTQL